MTTRSRTSLASSNTNPAREDADIYMYTLRVAYLSHLIHISTLSANTTSSTNGTTGTRANLKSSTSSFARPTEGWTTSLFSSLVDHKDSSSSKGVRYPKELLKVMELKLDRILSTSPTARYPNSLATSLEIEYIRLNDEALLQALKGFKRACLGPNEDIYKRLKENRKIEEMIMEFVKIASTVARSTTATTATGTTGGSSDAWKEVLNRLVADFVLLVRDGLRSREVGKIPQELMARLDGYCDKLGPPPPPLPMGSSPMLASGSRHGASDSVSSTDIHQMELVQAVGRLFGKSDADLQQDVLSIRRICTEKAAFKDLKVCINNLAQGARFPASRDDFDSDASFQTWKRRELNELQELLIEMITRKPELVHTTTTSPNMEGAGANVEERRSSAAGLKVYPSMHDAGSSGNISTVGSVEEDIAEHDFIFVPPNVKLYYRRLFSIALDHDYDSMNSLAPDEEVSLAILSNTHRKLLNECATRWRIMMTTRTTCFLELVGDYYKQEGFPEICVIEAIRDVDAVASEWEYELWPWSDRLQLFQALSSLSNRLLNSFFDLFQSTPDLASHEVVDLLSLIHQNVVFQEDARDLEVTLAELRQGMVESVEVAYGLKLASLRNETSREETIHILLDMLEWITQRTKNYHRQFPEPYLGSIDIPAIFLEAAAPSFIGHLNSSISDLLAITSNMGVDASDAEVLELYRRIIELLKMFIAFTSCPPLVIDLSSWFEPYILRWLAMTDAKTTEWVKRAIASDHFQAEGVDRHSSSIVDLIDSCKSATEFILKLKWPDEYENARYLTGLSKTIAKSIEQYSAQLEGLFLAEMFPRQEEDSVDQDVARPSAWLTKAKLAVQGDKKVQPFVFQSQSCVKLNNIQAARNLLDTMYTTLDADRVAILVRENASIPDRIDTPRYLFTVKIVLGENLVGRSDGSRTTRLDPFLILSDPHGERIAKTRTLYETTEPRWDETADVSVKGDLWLRATIYNRNLVEHHDIVGQAFVHLDPAAFSDFLARDVWISMKDVRGEPTDSRLLLRISMEGEKDDIQFYFGRAFRSLKRAENDMTRTIVDKMSPFVRHYLSMSTLRTLVKLPAFNLDLDLDKVRGDIQKVGGKLNAFVRDAIKSQSSPTSLIPPVRDYSTPDPSSPSLSTVKEKKKIREALTDQQMEDAIGDLFDYLSETLGVLKKSLSQEAWELVMSRLWKEILSTLESLVVPPLSDQPTEMRPLSEKEIDVVYKWLGFLVNFFHAQGQGVPLEDLRNAKYRDLIEARMFYDWNTDQLMEEAVRSMQRQLSAATTMRIGRTKSVYQQRNLGTIKARKIQKKQAQSTSGDMILRILRMRPDASEFVQGQIAVRTQLAESQAKLQRNSLQRRAPPQSNLRAGGGSGSSRMSAPSSRRGGGVSSQRLSSPAV